jgi:hypothetical protein
VIEIATPARLWTGAANKPIAINPGTKLLQPFLNERFISSLSCPRYFWAYI